MISENDENEVSSEKYMKVCNGYYFNKIYRNPLKSKKTNSY